MINQVLADETLNVRRTALVLRPKKPFYVWLEKMDPEDVDLPEELIEGDVYLLPDFEEKKQIEQWLKKHFDDFFCEQMFGWYTDEAVWVQNRTFKLFTEWFEYSLHTMVWDVVDGPIDKD